MATLFISYRHDDAQTFARRLRDDLRARGHLPWLDDAIRPGELWTQEIETAIDGCDALLAVLSEGYAQSKISRLEIEAASQRGKRLIPLLVHSHAARPLRLEGLQHVDFSNDDLYAERLETLAHAVLDPGWDSSGDDAARAHATRWDALSTRARLMAERVLAEHQGRPEQPGSFVPSLYVRRHSTEDALADFLTGDSAGLVLIGEAGVGKTSVLCHWVTELLDAGHVVLMYDCGALSDAEIEREIARDSALGSADGLVDALAQLDAQAPPGRRVVIIFDSVNEFRGHGDNGPEMLLRRINALISRLRGASVRCVLSCSSATWKHLDRRGPLRLDWGRYFRSGDEPAVRLRAFTPEEFELAYPLYRRTFDLFTPLQSLAPEVRDRLRDPVLLRMTAEAYRGVRQLLTPQELGLGVYRRFFEERVRHPRESWLIDELAGEMLTTGGAALPLKQLARHPVLASEILDEDGGSTYGRLLDRGVLQEWQADLRTGTVIKFGHSKVAAYAIALHLLQRSPGDSAVVRSLVDRTDGFALAWDAALALLLLGTAAPTILEIAESRDLEHRELACEALVGLHKERPDEALGLLQQLLAGESEEARRVALKAAYNIGPQARDIFLRAATAGSPTLRESVKSTLYLIWRNESPSARRKAAETLYVIWRHSPGFTYEVLGELLDHIALKNLPKVPDIVEFIVDVSVTIYINHCHDPEVIARTAAMYHDLLTRRLRLNYLKTSVFGPKVESLFFRAIARAFSGRILDWMLFGDVVPARLFFELPAQERACLARVAAALDPASHLDESVRDDLQRMLASDVPVFCGAAALVLAVHATYDLERTEPAVRAMFESLGEDGRLWLLAAFSVLLPDTPAGWIPMLEDLTRRYLDAHPRAFAEPTNRLLQKLDIVFLPLGLAYGKKGHEMPLFRTLLDRALAEGDTRLAVRCVAALGPVGFYYPEATLDLLEPLARELDDRLAPALITALATIRTIHFEAVDLFMYRLGVPDAFRRRVDAASDADLVHRYIRVIGYYNNAVHYSVHYPKMRRQLSMGALKLLADSPDPHRFIADYTSGAVRMLREADFQLLQWTQPD